jgi:hypothetical protein
MAWPPTLPTTGRADTTPMAATHPADHNLAAGALAALVNATARATSVTGTGGKLTSAAELRTVSLAIPAAPEASVVAVSYTVTMGRTGGPTTLSVKGLVDGATTVNLTTHAVPDGFATHVVSFPVAVPANTARTLEILLGLGAGNADCYSDASNHRAVAVRTFATWNTTAAAQQPHHQEVPDDAA